MRSVELFAGGGGLALGTSQAGFSHAALVEWNRDACDTIRTNQQRDLSYVRNWPLFEADVRSFDFGCLADDVDLLTAGPPCQPFSIGGKHKGYDDQRDMFPQVVRAVRELQPRAFIIENVRGLLRQSFAKYFEYVLYQLTYPTLLLRRDEDWLAHLSRLERHHTQGKYQDLNYRVVFRQLNAADYGVPQQRERVFIVGFRSDVGLEWAFPKPTHSEEALLWHQWVSKDYWQHNNVNDAQRVYNCTLSRLSKISKLKTSPPPDTQPWVTVREAISDLPEPASNVEIVANHCFIAGARVYKGHTGSALDFPAKTLKAGDHGVPGGENILVQPNNEIRYFTVRESARLQTFPDNYLFSGSWTEMMRQVGNAVPVKLAEVIASSVRTCLEHSAER